ncbi:MAG: hypothetical protein IJW00_09020 [Clostridia bacterium]|nr:hypothetical protein [Clostridia bacterium]
MSEAEKRRRQAYRLNRMKWIKVQALFLAGLLLFTAIFSLVFYNFNKAYYIEYSEKSDVEYKVSLKENDFYNSKYAEPDKAYVTSLIDQVLADFEYQLAMNTASVNFEYSYSIDAVLQIADKNGAIIYEKTDPIVAEKRDQSTSNYVKINESISVDYGTYNELAQRFTGFYDLSGTKSTLILEMHIKVIGDCEEFNDESSNQYVVALNVPLADKTVTMSVTSSVEEGDNVILASENKTAKNVFMVFTIVFVILTVLYTVYYVAFIYVTRNTDINYEIKVNRILKNYRSFIQKLANHFNEEGYQILMLSTFSEMLEIRDTIQSPVLMDENDDRTCTHFLIPTNTKLLYVFEIKVDDYDELYAVSEPVIEEPVPEPEPEPVIEEPAPEPEPEIVVLEEVEEELLEEAIASPDIALEQIDYVDEEVIEEREEGVEVISVVWPGKEKRNKLYRYDPNGEQVHDGDIVLVPSRDAAHNRDIIRKAAVAHGNHRVDPETLTHPLKKIIAIVKRKAEDVISGMPKAEVNAPAAKDESDK